MLQALFLSAIVTFAAWFFIQRKRRLSLFKDLGIPGPPPSFISGNLSELIEKGSAFAFKEWIDKYGDFVGFYNGAYPVIIVKDPELTKKIQIKDFANFHERGVTSAFTRTHDVNKQNMVNASGERWKETRSLLTPAFTSSNMKKMSVLMDDCTNEFLEVLKSHREQNTSFDAGECFHRLTADVIVRSAFGLKSDLQHKGKSNRTAESLLHDSLESFQQFRHGWRNYLTACFPELDTLWKLLFPFIAQFFSKTPTDNIIDDVTPIIQFRRNNREGGRTDLLQLMLNAEAEEGAPVNVHSLTVNYDGDTTPEENEPHKITNIKKRRFLSNTEIAGNGLAFFVAG